MTTGDTPPKSAQSKKQADAAMPPDPGALNGRENVEPMDTSDTSAPAATVSATNSGSSTTAEEDDDDYKPEATLTFTVDNFLEFSRSTEQRLQPTAVMVRGLPWRVLVMPRDGPARTAAGEKKTKSLGYFLQCNADGEQASWSCMAHATLRILSQREGIPHNERKISHTFYTKENDWGYSQFMTFDAIMDPNNPYYKDDKVIFQVHVSADAPHGVQWDSKKHTGYIGLKNQGATCYMNSLLQTLYFTNRLRQAVYEMRTKDDDPLKSVALSMQRVFYELQFVDKPVGTKNWDTFESFLQHDVQELCRVLLDNLEGKMKGNPAIENVIPELFEGEMKSYIRCTKVPFESSRTEKFYDIQLNVKSMGDLEKSFQEYIKVEMLDNDNKYDAGEHGLQPAEKGVIFTRLPPVLHLQLMRFQYDHIADANVKVNDRLSFPEELDLSAFVDPTVPQDKPPIYVLHAVLVHSGDFHGGHYVVFINPKGNGRWCKFDDDVVSRATKRDAIEANYGGEETEQPQRAYTNAYMLVYLRRADLTRVLCDVDKDTIPVELHTIMNDEAATEEKRKKEKSEAHLYATVNIIDQHMILSHDGLDFVDTTQLKPKTFRVPKAYTFDELYDEVAAAFGSHLQPHVQFRLYFVDSSLPQRRLVFLDDVPLQNGKVPTVGILTDHTSRNAPVGNDGVNVWLVMHSTQSANVKDMVRLPTLTQDDVLVFMKLFDWRTHQLRSIGTMYVNKTKPLSVCVEQVMHMARLRPADVQGRVAYLYEEQSEPRGTTYASYPMMLPAANVRDATLCDRMVPAVGSGALRQPSVERGVCELTEGQIFVCEWLLPGESREMPRDNPHSLLPPRNVHECYSQLLDRIELEATDKENDSCTISGHANLSWTYEQVLKWVAERVNELTQQQSASQHATSASPNGPASPAARTDAASPTTDDSSGGRSAGGGGDARIVPIDDHMHLQLYLCSTHNDRPSGSVEYKTHIMLRDILRHRRGDPPKGRLYFQRLPIRVDELDRRRMLRIQMVIDATAIDGGASQMHNIEEHTTTVYPERTASVRSVIDMALESVQDSIVAMTKAKQLKAAVEHDQAAPDVVSNLPTKYRLVIINSHRIMCVATDEQQVDAIWPRMQAGSMLRVEPVPHDQQHVEPSKEMLICVAHFNKDVMSTFGVPFIMKIKHGEQYSAIRDRVRKMLQVNEKDFDKYKFAIVNNQRPKYIDMNEERTVALNDLTGALGGTQMSVWLGLDHVNKARTSRSHPLEKAIIIHN